MSNRSSGTRQARLVQAVLQGALALGCAGLVLAPARECRAQGAALDEGRTRFTRGIDLYKEGNYHAALAEFRAAYAAAPSFRIHYNLGQTLYQLQDYAGAVRAFEHYLAEGADKIDAERRKEVDGELAKLRQRVAKLTISVVGVVGASPPQVEVSIDDEPRTEPQPILVSAGRRRISVTASGYQTETKVIDVAGAKQLEVKFELKPIGGAASRDSGPKVAAPVPMRPKSRGWFYAGLVGTGALGAGTATFAILTASNHSKFEKSLATPNTTKAAIDDARSATKTTALVGDIFAGATLLAGALTVIAFVSSSGQEPVPAPVTGKAPSAPKVAWQPVLSPAAVGVAGTF